MNTRFESIPIDLTHANEKTGIIKCDDLDDIYYRFERDVGTGTLTGTVEYQIMLTDGDNLGPWVALDISDTDARTVEIESAAFIRFRVGTAQSGVTGTLHIHLRQRAIRHHPLTP